MKRGWSPTMMMMIRRATHISLLTSVAWLCLISNFLSGQVTDFQTALEARLVKEFKSDIDLDLSLEQRFRENSLQYDRTMTTLEGSYKLGKGFSVGSGARWVVMKNTRLELVNRFRLHADLSYKVPVKPVSVSLRSMLQYGFDEQVLRKEPDLASLYDRNRIELGYHFFGTKISIQTGYELYTQLVNRERVVFCRSKTTAGVVYDFNRHSSLSFSWLYDREFNKADPQRAHMTGLSYTYKL